MLETYVQSEGCPEADKHSNQEHSIFYLAINFKTLTTR